MSAVRRSWAAFAICFVVTIAAVGWISWTALRLERASQREADREESVRLALWRMESVLAPLIAEEASRPVFGYPVVDQAGNPVQTQELDNFALANAPIPVSRSPYVRLQFRVLPDGSITSSTPLSPTTEPARPTAPRTTTSSGSGARLRDHLDIQALRASLPAPHPTPSEQIGATDGDIASSPVDTSNTQIESVAGQVAKQSRQHFRNDLEVQARSRRFRSPTYGYNAVPQQTMAFQTDQGSEPDLIFGALTPMWLGAELFLARRVRLDGLEHIQGSWLDWAELRTALLAEVRDLLPAATLQPVLHGDAGGSDPHALAALPVRLVPGAQSGALPTGLTPLRTSLVVAWACVVLAGGAVALLLAAALSLSERRRDFVSAVSHELRTPLTTFRMYTEMLANDMIPDASKRRRYIEKLAVEADRLSHLVENVLAYARLEGRRTPARLGTHRIGDLIENQRDRLSDHAAASGLELHIRYIGEARAAEMPVEPASLEQILFNLVDNATKYGRPVAPAAGESERPRVHLDIALTADAVHFDVSDTGPGIADEERSRLFKPFTKSDSRAAESRPGVGLGLSICRRLARAMNGELSLLPASVGAHFRLRLPR
ncbi:MAG: sensor histidine kinase [Planctomycetota bacterium]